MPNIIQIAGIRNQNEARMLVECGVDYLGFPLRLDFHKEDLCESNAANIISKLPDSTRAVLITYLQDASEIFSLLNRLGTFVVQLHADISVEEIRKLKKVDTAIQVIKSLIIRENNLPALQNLIPLFTPYVDAFIVDTFDPVTGASGATGKVHDWEISRRIVEFSPKPVILAGGLNGNNVKDAILKVRPAGVDVHTGVEDKLGHKDRRLVERFISEAKTAFSEIN